MFLFIVSFRIVRLFVFLFYLLHLIMEKIFKIYANVSIISQSLLLEENERRRALSFGSAIIVVENIMFVCTVST